MPQLRHDYFLFPQDGEDDKKAKVDSYGILRGVCPVTRIGIFEYMEPDGSVRREYRPEEEVFADESLNTIKQIPITLDHPKEGYVDSKIASDEAIGATGETVYKKDHLVMASLMIHDKNAIETIRAKKMCELSLGYTADIDNTPGEYLGHPYDCIQRNIRYNHLSVVETARAGHEARITVDSLGVCMTEKKQDGEKQNLSKDPYEKPHIFIGDIEGEVKSLGSRIDAIESSMGSKYTMLEKKMDSLHRAVKRLRKGDRKRKDEDEEEEEEDVEQVDAKDEEEEREDKPKKDKKKEDGLSIEERVRMEATCRANALMVARESMRTPEFNKIKNDATDAICDKVLVLNGYESSFLASKSMDFKSGLLEALSKNQLQARADATPVGKVDPTKDLLLSQDEERALRIKNGGHQ